jgi:type I restriction enzyme S subunit
MRLRHAVDLVEERGSGQILPYIALEHIVSGTGQLIDCDLPRRAAGDGEVLIESGDVLYGKLRPYLNKVVHVSQRAAASTELLALRAHGDLESRYLYHLILSRRFLSFGNSASYGVKMPRTSWVLVRTFQIEPPKPQIQRKIAGFLDRETERIDALIDKKRRLIDLLEEKRTATRDAVIAGIDAPTAQLGSFVVSLTQGRSTQAGARPREEAEWGILKLSAVRRGEYRPVENKALAEGVAVEPSLGPQPGDLLVTRANTPLLVGDVCAVTTEYPRVLLPDLIYRIRLDARVDPQFVSMTLLGSRARFHFASTARGSSGSMVKLRAEDIRSIQIPIPPIVQAALSHVQFETIHPFLDGNGRVGRILITLLLMEKGVLSEPLLYLSLFLKANRTEYYDRLGAVRTRGDWEGRLKFFLTGVTITANDAARVAHAVSELHNRDLRTASELGLGSYGPAFLDLLAEHPVVTVSFVTERLGASRTTAGQLLEKAATADMIEETTGKKRNRIYRYSELIDLFSTDEPLTQ